MKKIFCLVSLIFSLQGFTQNELQIPPTVTTSTVDLNIQTGNVNFYNNIPTPTFGINGPILAPTIVAHKGDNMLINVTNGLPVTTTIHWHGLHVSSMNDGGPHQKILAGAIWSPAFEVLNNAGTFWYHPHGEGKTDLHVSRGIAGMFIIHDAVEATLNVPLTYGVDDIPLVVQSKAFDQFQHIAISTEMDTSIMVNGTIDPFLNAPSQVVRFRLLNGSSMRAYNFGFSNGMSFYQITTDGGYIATPIQLTRLLMAPGERVDILVDLTTFTGQSFDLMSYASEMPLGIYGSTMVGTAPDTIPGYSLNPLNGIDFPILHVNVGAQTTTPVPITTIPSQLVPYVPYNAQDATVNRLLVFDTITTGLGMEPNLAEGQFGINGTVFNMDSINIRIPLNSTEIWTLQNKTHVAHPFHIHDIQFNVIEKNGTIPSASETGWKDVILVMPHDSVKFITKFTDFADDVTPYMYHCHLLHHEDDGMMGSFIVFDSTNSILDLGNENNFVKVFPNPTNDAVNIVLKIDLKIDAIQVVNMNGKVEKMISDIEMNQTTYSMDIRSLKEGIYLLKVISDKGVEIIKVQKI
ncbi:MAG: multicopper oxidase domain-containing protein [Flavobacteriia bacterium]|nr:multicopper oxidase domain-containing protein [Flavobacteriia bacterium]